MPEYPYISINMHEYTRICVNTSKSFRFTFPHFKCCYHWGPMGLRAGAVNLDIPFSTLCSWFRITIIIKQLIRLFVITQHFLRKFSKRDTITGHCCSQATKPNFAKDTFFLKKTNAISPECINIYNFDLNIFFQKTCKFVRTKLGSTKISFIGRCALIFRELLYYPFL